MTTLGWKAIQERGFPREIVSVLLAQTQDSICSNVVGSSGLWLSDCPMRFSHRLASTMKPVIFRSAVQLCALSVLGFVAL